MCNFHFVKAFVADSILTDSIKSDSIASDSIPTKKREAGIEAPIDFVAKDSMVYDAKVGLAFLYGEAEVKYQNMELTAAQIAMNMDSSMVRAHGVTDSTGFTTGIPVFRDGDTPYESDRISYNFKSQQGYINNVFTAQGDGFMMGEAAKKDSTGAFYAYKGKYSKW